MGPLLRHFLRHAPDVVRFAIFWRIYSSHWYRAISVWFRSKLLSCVFFFLYFQEITSWRRIVVSFFSSFSSFILSSAIIVFLVLYATPWCSFVDGEVLHLSESNGIYFWGCSLLEEGSSERVFGSKGDIVRRKLFLPRAAVFFVFLYLLCLPQWKCTFLNANLTGPSNDRFQNSLGLVHCCFFRSSNFM